MPKRVAILVQRGGYQYLLQPSEWVEDVQTATTFHTYMEALQAAQALRDPTLELVIIFAEGGSISWPLSRESSLAPA